MKTHKILLLDMTNFLMERTEILFFGFFKPLDPWRGWRPKIFKIFRILDFWDPNSRICLKFSKERMETLILQFQFL